MANTGADIQHGIAHNASFIGLKGELSKALRHASKRQKITLMSTLVESVDVTAPLTLCAQVAQVGDDAELPAEALYHRETMLLRLMSRFGIPTDTLERAWAKAVEDTDLTSYRQCTIMRMCQLEGERPGICKALYESDRICNFALQEPEVWIAQYDALERTDVAYGHFFMPAYNHSGTGWNAVGRNAAFFDDLQAMQCVLRVSEVGSALAIGAKIIESEKKYGGAQFGVLATHGAATSLQLNRLTKGGRPVGRRIGITAETLQHPAADEVAGAWDSAAPWVVLACTWHKKPWQRRPPRLLRQLSERFPDITIIGAPENSLVVAAAPLNTHQSEEGAVRIEPVFNVMPSWKLLRWLSCIRVEGRYRTATEYRGGRVVAPSVDTLPHDFNDY